MPDTLEKIDCPLFHDVRNVPLPKRADNEKLLDIAALFGNGNDCELEIGSGRGMFLQRESVAHPNRNYIGVEWSLKFALEGATRIAAAGPENVRILCADARTIVPLIADRAIRAAHIYYPDPWWKRRHRKRRIMQADFLTQIARVVMVGGRLHFATDVEEYFNVSLKTVAKLPQFRQLEETAWNKTASDHDYLTHFERKYRLMGKPVFRAQWEITEPMS